MNKYFLKPGTYTSSKSVPKDTTPPGLNLENYIVSVINNPTCCIKNLGGGGIEGTMLAMATATGTPEENGQSVIDAYNEVAGNHYDVIPEYEAATNPIVDYTSGSSSFTYNPGAAGQYDYFEISGISPLTNLPILGKMYKATITTVDQNGQNPVDESLYFIAQFCSGTTIRGIYQTYGNEASSGVGFFKQATRALANPAGLDYDPQTSTSFNVATQTIEFEEVIVVKPVVLMPPGVYTLPSNLDVNYPVDFVGMDKNATILNTGYNKTIRIGYGHYQVWNTDIQMLINGEIAGKNQSITFSNMSISMGTWSSASMSYVGEFIGLGANNSVGSGIRFVECNMYSGVGNNMTLFGYYEYNDCLIHDKTVNFSQSAIAVIYIVDCEFIGDGIMSPNYSLLEATTVGGIGIGGPQMCAFFIDHNKARGLHLTMNPNNSSLNIKHTSVDKFVYDGGTSTFPWTINYVDAVYTPDNTGSTNVTKNFVVNV